MNDDEHEREWRKLLDTAKALGEHLQEVQLVLVQLLIEASRERDQISAERLQQIDDENLARLRAQTASAGTLQ